MLIFALILCKLWMSLAYLLVLFGFFAFILHIFAFLHFYWQFSTIFRQNPRVSMPCYQKKESIWISLIVYSTEYIKRNKHKLIHHKQQTVKTLRYNFDLRHVLKKWCKNLWEICNPIIVVLIFIWKGKLKLLKD